MKNWIDTIKNIFADLGPTLAFYLVNHFYGAKPAIAASLAVCAAEMFRKLKKGEELSKLFKYTTVMTVVFGLVDLRTQNSYLYKYEPCVTNIMTGIFFAVSLFGKSSIIQDLREKNPEAAPMTPERVVYFRWLTVVWVLYFFAKAGAYGWMATRMEFESALVLRMLFGSASFYVMLFGSIYGSPKVFAFLQERGWLGTANAQP